MSNIPWKGDAFGDPMVIGLFEAPPHGIALAGGEGKQVGAHGQSPNNDNLESSYQQLADRPN